MRYYGVFDRREADFPMNFGLMALGLDGTLDQNIIKTLIQGGVQIDARKLVYDWLDWIGFSAIKATSICNPC